jgi:hypothetical protein
MATQAAIRKLAFRIEALAGAFDSHPIAGASWSERPRRASVLSQDRGQDFFQ